ncbi:hypothetical protein [Enterococcus rivorum]
MMNMARDLEESLYERETKAEQIRALELIERDGIEETYRTTKRITKNDDELFFGWGMILIFYLKNNFNIYWSLG